MIASVPLSARCRVLCVSAAVQVWTVGHSNHSAAHFVGLLRGCGIEVVADVRSQPYAKYVSHFSQSPLRLVLAEAGVDYLFLGHELGGRPPEPEMYDDEGHVLYGALAATARFGAGLARLREVAFAQRVAMMCSEEDPAACHRRVLVTRAMLMSDPASSVAHIRGDGKVVDEADLSRAVRGDRQLPLFEEAETWRSVRSASPSTLLRASSGY